MATYLVYNPLFEQATKQSVGTVAIVKGKKQRMFRKTEDVWLVLIVKGSSMIAHIDEHRWWKIIASFEFKEEAEKFAGEVRGTH